MWPPHLFLECSLIEDVLQMNKLFARTNLPRCHRDWCTKVIVMQYLQNYRKNLKRSKTAAQRAIEDLPDPDELEKQFRDEAANGDDSEEPDEDNGWVGEDDLDAAAASGKEDGDDLDDDDTASSDDDDAPGDIDDATGVVDDAMGDDDASDGGGGYQS
jgi:hypothetical protein